MEISAYQVEFALANLELMALTFWLVPILFNLQSGQNFVVILVLSFNWELGQLRNWIRPVERVQGDCIECSFCLYVQAYSYSRWK